MTLYTIMPTRQTGRVLEDMLTVLFPDATTILDTTYGNGAFWKGSARQVIALDKDRARARDVCADFTALPFRDASVDVVVFDPPYHTDMGKGKPSVMGARFGAFPTLADLRAALTQGCLEARRVARVGVIVKVQDYVHASRVQWMDQWVIETLGLPYERVIQPRTSKICDPKWGSQLSAYRNHGMFLAYRTDGDVHKRRRSA